MITQSQLKELLHYDPDTGIFTWNIFRGGYAAKGSIAGSIHHTKYIRIKISGLENMAHRLVFLYMTGKFPTLDVDHINNDKSDNRWHNLRECTSSQNSMNKKIRSDNTSGYKGVSWNKRAKKWVVTIGINRKNQYLGLFICKHEAALAYNERALKLHGRFAKINEL